MRMTNTPLDLQRFGEDAAPAAAAPARPDNSAASEQPAGSALPAGQTASSPAAAPAQSAPASAPDPRPAELDNAAARAPAPGADPAPPADRLAARRSREVQGIWQGWLRECGEVQRSYPGFDLAAELADPDFARLLRSGVTVRTAYQARHLDELLGGAMQYAATRAAESAAARYAARAARPDENGARPAAGAVVRPDVARMTPAQRAEMERRAVRGETIAL